MTKDKNSKNKDNKNKFSNSDIDEAVRKLISIYKNYHLEKKQKGLKQLLNKELEERKFIGKID